MKAVVAKVELKHAVKKKIFVDTHKYNFQSINQLFKPVRVWLPVKAAANIFVKILLHYSHVVGMALK